MDVQNKTMTETFKLILVKTSHTVIWAAFASAIVAIFIFTYVGNTETSFILISVVMIEVAILAANGFKCPLTGVAAKYTDAREDNFDIYLPFWLAKYNKHIFGVLYGIGIFYTLVSYFCFGVAT